MSYTSLVIVKLIMALLGGRFKLLSLYILLLSNGKPIDFPGLLAIIATVMFALQIDEQERFGFKISRGISFYIQVSAAACGNIKSSSSNLNLISDCLCR